MKLFELSKIDYADCLQDLKTKKQTYAYDNRGYKYLIYITCDNDLRCCRCLGNLTTNMSLKTSKCGFIDKWGV